MRDGIPGAGERAPGMLLSEGRVKRYIMLSGSWMRNPVSKKPMKEKGNSGSTLLVDAG
jgi:hypothetical protein